MSVFNGAFDLNTTHRGEFVKWPLKAFVKKAPNTIDDGTIVDASRDHITLNPNKRIGRSELDLILCPNDRDMDVVDRAAQQYPVLKEKEFKEPMNERIIERHNKDLKRTCYQIDYCDPDETPFSLNLVLRAKARQTLRLPNDTKIPETSYGNHYRPLGVPGLRTYPIKPKDDREINQKVREIMKVKTGQSTYHEHHGLLGQAVLDTSPYGLQREEPRRSRWKRMNSYTWPINN